MDPMSSDFAPPNEPGSYEADKPSRSAGFRRAILRGLGVVLPPLLTIVVLIWAWNSIDSYVLGPIEYRIRQLIVWQIEDTKTGFPEGAIATNERRLDGFTFNDKLYVPDPTGRRFFPEYVKSTVDEQTDYFGPFTPAPSSALRLTGTATCNWSTCLEFWWFRSF